MSLHIEPSIIAKHRVRWQRVIAGAVGIAGALVLLVVAGSLMDGVKLRGVPEYQPQFVMKEFEEPGGCGGCGGLPVKWPSWKKPTAPSSGVRPLGLAPHAPSERLFMTVEEWDSAVPVVDFGDDERW